jgi:hypothetical protein
LSFLAIHSPAGARHDAGLVVPVAWVVARRVHMEPGRMSASKTPAPLEVVIIAASRATVAELGTYLSNAGVVAGTAAALTGPAAIPASVDAVILFPDELEVAEVTAGIAALRRARPRLLLVVVTGAPQRLRPALDPDGRSFPPIVLPRPAFSWTILDAVREHARGASVTS